MLTIFKKFQQNRQQGLHITLVGNGRYEKNCSSESTKDRSKQATVL